MNIMDKYMCMKEDMDKFDETKNDFISIIINYDYYTTFINESNNINLLFI